MSDGNYPRCQMQRNLILKRVLPTCCFLLSALTACRPGSSPTLALPSLTAISPTLHQSAATPIPPSQTPLSPTQTAIPATPIPSSLTPTPEGRTLLVISSADSGPGTLRQALIDALPYDTIAFDPAVFPPDAPVRISLVNGLPEISQGHLTIDASHAGVILDGNGIRAAEPQNGISITSDDNIVRGLQITGFSNAGTSLSGGAQGNMIGGARTIGEAPLGQGNLISGNGSFGVGLWEGTTSFNTIQGNYIGIQMDGASTWGQARDGIHSNGATQNLIVDNVIGGSDGAGVYLCCVSEGRNTVTNNLIGVGPTGSPLSNSLAGVIIDRSSRNVVGPGNTIAHNSGNGISLWEDTPNNTITQNSIFANGEAAIRMQPVGMFAFSGPLVLDYDLAGGTIAGQACPGCTVEIFSDAEDEAGIFEGSTMADQKGVFSFSKGAAFTGAHLTAMATTPDGQTGWLNEHTSGQRNSAILQSENPYPRVGILIKSLDELQGNRIGDVFDRVSKQRYPLPCQPPEQEWAFSHVADMGFSWVRLSIDRLEWWENGDTSSTRSMGEYSSAEFNACQDGIISALADHDVEMVHTIVFWDEAVHSARIPDYRNEAEVQGYLDYARLLVRHYKDWIEYYGILNEAELFVDIETYLNLIRRAIPVIREEYPEAKIVVGGTANLMDPRSQAYLNQILTSDVMPQIDAIELHPMYGASPQFDHTRQYYYDYPTMIGEIKRVAAAHGFTGELMATELSWSTEENPDPASSLRYSIPQVAKYYARGIVLHSGLDMWVAVGGPYWMPPVAKVVRNLTTIMDGASPIEVEVEIESEATNLISFGFSLPDGDRLLALWSNGAAVDDDPGVSATLSFPGTSARSVTGIDVLNGFQQELDAEMLNGNLVISHLLVKDYPIILRLSGE